jgi:tripartite-type tricarboxylate transporter receptor subunit TctC
MMRSPSAIASAMSCVTKTMVRCVRRQILEKLVAHLLARAHVQRRERLVHQQDARLHRHGMAGIDMRHVPYKGGAPTMNDLIGGHVQALLISITLAAPQVRGSKVRAMGVGGDKRALLLPQVPTFAEGGYPEFSPHTWTGLFLPAGTPPAIVQRVHQEHARALRFPEVEARFRELGAEIVMNSPAQFAAQLRAENEQLGNIIRERKISAD